MPTTHSLHPARALARLASVAFGAVVLASLAMSVNCASAVAQPVGYLYSALESSIDEYEVGSDATLTSKGFVPGSGVSPNNPSTLVMAKTADGENLYQLEATPNAQAIRQYSVASDGLLSAKTPATVGSVPEPSVEDPHFMAVFNPAANGEPGQNALYVLSAGTKPVGERAEPAEIAIFDIDAVTGALTAAGTVPVPGVFSPFGFAYSGKRMAILGYNIGKALRVAEVEPSTGELEFPDPTTDAPCGPYVGCVYTPMAMLDPEQMLARGVDETHEIFPAFLDSAPAYEVGGGWGNIANNPVGQHLGPSAITVDGDLYYVTSFDPIEVYTGNEEKEFPADTRGEAWVEAFTPDGEPDGSFQLPAKGGVPTGIFSLGSALYISNEAYFTDKYEKGSGFRLASGQLPTQTSEAELGSAMTGFLIGTSTGGGGEEQENPGGASGGGSGGTSGANSGGGSGGSGGGNGSGGGTGVPPASSPSSKLAPPNTKIVSVKISGAHTTIAFKGLGGVGKLSFRCRLGASKKVTCHSPLVYHHLVTGKHHFSVYAIDSRPVADPTPAKTTFTTK
jgi:hypothetical protein